jgi:hemerythrin superfamily protein
MMKKAQKQIQELDEITPMLVRNSEETTASEESVIMPFVQSKRPEVLIRKHKKRQSQTRQLSQIQVPPFSTS